jgi:tRNA (cmo5U34)-methyltransferase
VRERGVGEEDLAAALVRMREDKPSTLEEQKAWLKEVGFRQVDCPYKNYSFAVYGGRKRV